MDGAKQSEEARRALAQARSLAAEDGAPPDSLHVLRALCLISPRARAVLAPAQLSEDAFALPWPAPGEPPLVFARLLERAQEVADNAGANSVDGLHLLVVLLRTREGRAFYWLEHRGHLPARLRQAAVAAMAEHAAAVSQPAAQTYRAVAERTLLPPVRHPPAAPKSQLPPRKSPVLERLEHAAPKARRVTRKPERARRQKTPSRKTAPKKAAARTGKKKGNAQGTLRPLEEVAPALSECAIDLTARARQGQLDPAIGRDQEIEAVADVLGKRRANNPVLIGPPGVGKTAIVEGLARVWAQNDATLTDEEQRRLVALDTTALVAGTSLRGAFSERFGAIKQEVARAGGRLVVFIDEVHMLIGAGASGDGPQDAAGELKTALARGEFPCIGATTPEEFRRYIEKDAALERRFSPIDVKEPSVALAKQIVAQSLLPYEQHHDVVFAVDAIDAAVTLSHKFVAERKLPDKAFAALDLAGSRARRKQQPRVSHKDVAQVIHEWTGVPMERLAESDAARFAQAEKHLSAHVVGHGHVIEALARALRRGFAGFNGQRPMGSFLFLGPTGVGKTEMAKALAAFVFGHADAMVRIDMSELTEAHAVARLLGAQPGYVGYEEGGQLTEALRKRPFQIVLFDEVEKAHPDVVHVLLQILDEGHVTDAQARKVSFAHTIVLLTSNLGAQALGEGHHIGFGGRGTKRQTQNVNKRVHDVLEAARDALPPELWSRLDDHLVFLPLSEKETSEVARRQLDAQRTALVAQRQVQLTWDEDVIAFLLRGSEKKAAMGTRGLRQMISRFVEAPIAEGLLSGDIVAPSSVRLSLAEDGQGLVATPG